LKELNIHLIINKMINIKNFALLILLALISFIQASGQDNEKNSTNFTLGSNIGFDFSPNGNTYGFLFDITTPFYSNKNQTISLCAGIQEDFQIHLERGFEGTTGSAISNSIHMIWGPSFYFFKTRKANLDVRLFGGWSYKSINGKLHNQELNIDRSYSDNTHYLSRGLLIQTGYLIKTSIYLSLFFKTDLRRLTDGDGILEYPPKLYGVGIIKKLNSH